MFFDTRTKFFNSVKTLRGDNDPMLEPFVIWVVRTDPYWRSFDRSW